MIVVEPSHSLSTAKLHVFSQNRKKIPMNIVLETNKKQLEQNRTKDICLRHNVNYLRPLGFAAFFLHFITKAARWFDYVAQRRKNTNTFSINMNYH